MQTREKASHLNTDPQEPMSVKWKVKCLCAAGSCVITRLNGGPSLSVVLNLQPVPEVCCRLQRPMKEYRLFVIGSVTTECTRQQMRNRKKMLWGLKCHVNSWVQPLNTSGVLSTPFNAFKGQGFVQTGLCCYSPWWCERPQFPGTTREAANSWK